MTDAPADLVAKPNHSVAALVPWMCLLLITVGTGMQPLSTDLYLPSLPGIEHYFGISKAQVQWTLSVFVVCFGLSQLLVGPLSDRFGRYPTLLAAGMLYTLGSIVCLLAPSIYVLVSGRAIQAVAACCGMVGARSIVRDLYSPQDGARMLARSGSFMSVVPMLGPVLAAWLEVQFGWRAAFAVLTLFGVCMLVLIKTAMRETNQHKDARATEPKRLIAGYLEVVKTRTFLSYAACGAASYAGLFAFISGSSFVFIQILGVSTKTYGMIFGSLGFGYLLGTLVCRRLLQRFGYRRVLMGASVWSFSCALMLLGVALAGWLHPLALLAPMFGYVIGHGLVNPCAQAGALAMFAHRAGTANALMNFLTMLVASVVGLWIGTSFNGTVLPLVGTVFISGCVLLLSGQGLVRTFGQVP